MTVFVSSFISFHICLRSPGTPVLQVTATDADDSSYGNSAKLVYSILQGQPYFSVEPDTGECAEHMEQDGPTVDVCP